MLFPIMFVYKKRRNENIFLKMVSTKSLIQFFSVVFLSDFDISLVTHI